MSMHDTHKIIALSLAGLSFAASSELRAAQKGPTQSPPAETTAISATTNPVGIVQIKKGSAIEIATALSAARANPNYGAIFHSAHIDLSSAEQKQAESMTLMMTLIPGEKAYEAVAALSPVGAKLTHSVTTGKGVYVIHSTERAKVQKGREEIEKVSGGKITLTITGREAFTIYAVTPPGLPRQ